MTAIDWTQPLELLDGTPVVFRPGPYAPDFSGSYWLVREDGELFTERQMRGQPVPAAFTVTPEGRVPVLDGTGRLAVRNRAEPAAECPAPWALARADELGAGRGAFSREVRDAFARYIEAHEQPPVDPDLLLAREALARLYDGDTARRAREGRYDSYKSVRATLWALKRRRPEEQAS